METESQTLPMVSVIMPARNEDKYIAKAIASIRRQNYPQDLIEIIVVDNGSTDGTVAAAEASGAKVIVKTNCRVGAVRNEGARICNGRVLAFLDSDCEAGADWLRKAVELLAAPGVGAVGGVYCTPEHATWVERVWAPNREILHQEVDFLACSSLVVNKTIFDQLHGFDEQLEAAEDDDFSRKVRGLGKCLLSVPECAVVHHGYPQKLMAIARRQMWHGTNQLESARGITDQLLILTHVFLFGLVIAALGLLGSMRGIFVGLAVMAAVVFIATLGRIYSYRYRDGGTVMFVQLYIVLLFYFFGRAVGLVKNYFKLIAKSTARAD